MFISILTILLLVGIFMLFAPLKVYNLRSKSKPINTIYRIIGICMITLSTYYIHAIAIGEIVLPLKS